MPLKKICCFLASLAVTSSFVQAQAPFSVDSSGNVVGNSFDGELDWLNLVNVPAGFADGTDNGAAYDNVLVVAKAGGDFMTVENAISNTTDAAEDNRYLVLVAPGIYTVTSSIHVRGYVHLKGFGPASEIRSSLSDSVANADAATVFIDDLGRISELKIVNSASTDIAIAVYGSTGASRDTFIDGVVAEATGSGGDEHYAVFLDDSELTIRDSVLFAEGASGFGTAVNAAFGSVNVADGFPQALIEGSQLRGGAANFAENCNDPTGTGYGMKLTNSSPTVRHSFICGGHRAVQVETNGHATVHASQVKVSTTSQAYLFEITASGSIRVGNSGVSYLGNKFTGAGTSGLSCAHVYSLGTFAVLTDATNSSTTACN